MKDETELKGPVLPLGRPTIGSAGETGDWRTIKPVFTEENCIKCYKCWLSCPEGTIRVNSHGEYPYIDYIFCKGCGVCAHICPGKKGNKALKMVPETE